MRGVPLASVCGLENVTVDEPFETEAVPDSEMPVR
jgi:hypothetical protein